MANPFTQQVLWTALPAGVQDGRLRLTVFVSPRLYSNQTAPQLASWPDFADWPKALATAKFTVDIAGKSIPDGDLTRQSHPDSAVWTSILPGAVRIVPYTFPDYTQRPVWSYPVMNVAGYVESLYTKAAVTSPEELIEVGDAILGPLGDIEGTKQQDLQINGFLGQMKERQLKALEPQPANAEVDFALARWFHEPKSNVLQPLPKPDLDFHQAVSALGGHPRLLRHCGLAIDLLLPLTPGEVPGNGQVQVKASWTEAVPTKHVSPRTHYEIVAHPDTGEPYFETEPRGGGTPIKQGLLQLDRPRYDVLQFDPDSATFALRQLAVTRRLKLRAEKGHRLGLPTLRSAGLMIVRTGLAVDLARAFAQHRDHQQASQAADPHVYLEDVTRGWALDVWDEASKRWYSVCLRDATYDLGAGQKLVETGDEGWVAMGATSEVGGGNDLFLHEVLFRWDGWSLAAERPGKVVMPDGSLSNPGNQPIAPLQLSSAFDVPPGSLPRLRFGRTYRFRARVVDLAGGRVALNPKAGFAAATEPAVYRRFEPVAYPALVPRPSLAKRPAEKVDHLVIRSNVLETAQAYAGKFALAPDSQRHIVPPQVSPSMAESHGMLDGPTVGLSKNAFDLLRAFDGVLPEHLDADQLDIPFLADPLSRGASFRGLPGSKGNTIHVGFENTDQTWPNVRPFRLVITEGPHGDPVWDANTRTLTVNLEKSEIRTVRLSSHPGDDDLDLFAIWDFIRGQATEAVKRAVLDGRHWMVTPYRELVLVHAVQQPLEPTSISQLASARQVGETAARLTGSFVNHSKSTGKVDLLAAWTEPIDDLSQPGPSDLPGAAHVHEQSITYPTDLDAKMVSTPFSTSHEFGDTKHRAIGYHCVATTRFREYLPISDEDIAAGLEPITQLGPVTMHDVLSSARPAAPDVAYVIPTFRWERSTQGAQTTSRRHGGGLRVWLRRPWFTSGAGELLGAVLWPEGQQGNPKELHSLTTYWGNDPVWQSTALPSMRPAYAAFANPAAAFESQLALAELANFRVGVAGFAVEYDSTREMWYGDLELKPTGSYWPFIRLALARYQPKSINKDVKLSPVVLADYAQLPPERSAVVTREANQLVLSVSGPVYASSAAGAGGTVMEAGLEHKAGPDNVDWLTIGGPIVLERQRLVRRGASPAWRGTLPLQQAPGGHPLRVVTRESERLPSDTGTTSRVVYADAIELG